MYWFSRPPYGRWALAALVVIIAAYMDLSGPAVEPYPYVVADVGEGESPAVEWRNVPVGVLPPAGDPSGRAVAAIERGTPLVASLLESTQLAPSDWWSVSIDLPAAAVVGSEALLALPDQIVPAVVVDVGLLDTFGGASEGLVAVAPEHAAVVANAVSTRSVIVLIRP